MDEFQLLDELYLNLEDASIDDISKHIEKLDALCTRKAACVVEKAVAINEYIDQERQIVTENTIQNMLNKVESLLCNASSVSSQKEAVDLFKTASEKYQILVMPRDSKIDEQFNQVGSTYRQLRLVFDQLRSTISHKIEKYSLENCFPYLRNDDSISTKTVNISKNNLKNCIEIYPTDELWKHYQNHQKIVFDNMLKGSGFSKTRGNEKVEIFFSSVINMLKLDCETLLSSATNNVIFSHQQPLLSNLDSQCYSISLLQYLIEIFQNLYSTVLLRYLDQFIREIEHSSDYWLSLDCLQKTKLPPFINIHSYKADATQKQKLMSSTENMVFVADDELPGVWWEKKIAISQDERTIQTVHEDEANQKNSIVENISGMVHVLASELDDVCPESPRKKKRNSDREISKRSNRHQYFIGARVLLNNGSSRWLEGKVTDKSRDQDSKDYMLHVSINASLRLLLNLETMHKTLSEMDQQVFLRFAPSDPNPRINAGYRILNLIHLIDDRVKHCASSFPFDEDDSFLFKREMWSCINQSFLPARFILERYFRSQLAEQLEKFRTVFSLDSPSKIEEPEFHYMSTIESIFENMSNIIEEYVKDVSPLIFNGQTIEFLHCFLTVLVVEAEKLYKWICDWLPSFSTFDTSKISLENIFLAIIIGANKLMVSWETIYHSICSLDGRSTNDDIKQKCIKIKYVFGELLTTTTYFMYNYYFAQFSNFVVMDTSLQEWSSSKSFRAETRCSYGVQMLIFRLHVLDFNGAQYCSKYKDCSTLRRSIQIWHEFLLQILSNCLKPIAFEFFRIVPSRTRRRQYKIDILYLVTGVSFILESIATQCKNKDLSFIVTNSSIAICLKLLSCVAIICGPCDLILQCIKKKCDTNMGNTKGGDNLLEYFRKIIKPLDPKITTKNIESSAPWLRHVIMHISKDSKVSFKWLLDEELNWADVLTASDLTKDELINLLEKRHELNDWEFPQLSDEEEKDKVRLHKFLQSLQK